MGDQFFEVAMHSPLSISHKRKWGLKTVNMLLNAVSRFYILKFHSTSLFGAVICGLCSVNFGFDTDFS
jgi:hypothetical protein